MKKIFCLVIFLFTETCIGQPVLDSTNSSPRIGEFFDVNRLALSVFNPGPAGQNQIWNFSTPMAGGAYNVYMNDPAGTPYAALYGSSNVSPTISGIPEYYYCLSTSAANIILGNANPNYGSPPVYMNPKTILQYPFAYNDQFIDTFLSNYIFVAGGGYPFRFYGSITVHADGYGTLITPYDTIDNTLRIYTDEFEIDTIYLHNNNYTIDYNHYYSYEWRVPGIHYPIFKMGKTNNSNFYEEYLQTNLASNTAEHPSENIFLSVIPNPFHEKAIIRFILKENKNVKLILIDCLGKIVKTFGKENVPVTENQCNLDASGLSPGIYFLEASDFEKINFFKIVIE